MPPKENPYAVRRTTKRFEGHALLAHRHGHVDPSHHIGPCTSEDRHGGTSHVHREGRHLYRGASARFAKADFTRRYGKKKGAFVYGATIGKVKRQQLLARRAQSAYIARQRTRRHSRTHR